MTVKTWHESGCGCVWMNSIAQGGSYWKHKLAQRVCKGSWKSSAKSSSCESREIRTGWQTCSCGTEALMWLPVTWEVLARLRLVPSSLEFPFSHLSCLHEEINKTHMKCENSCLCRENNWTYLHRSICLSLYMQFSTSVHFERLFRRQQKQICKRNPSLEDEIYLLSLHSFLSHI